MPAEPKSREPILSAALAGSILTVDLAAVRANYRLLQARLGRAECAAVVKADGYGLGAVRVAGALADAGCRRFFVAHAGEAMSLRAGLGAGPEILVLNGLPPGAEDAARQAGLVPVVNSRQQAEAWAAEARRTGERLPVAIQVDSGMSRIGLEPAAFPGLLAEPGVLGPLDVRLLMSHLAVADEPKHPANRAQLAAFEAMRRLMPGVPASLANSSGIFLGPAYHFDLARPGAALYGINPTPGAPNPMRPAVRLEAKVIQTRSLPAGAGVGYGHSFVTGGPFRAATISLGYADGWPRHAIAAAFFRGKRLPFVGRVSMDSIILDITSLAEGELKAGDLVELIGPDRTIDDIAALAGTIGYEILTGLGHRFHRAFVDRDPPGAGRGEEP